MTQTILLISIFILLEMVHIIRNHTKIDMGISDRLADLICMSYQTFLAVYMAITHTARTDLEWEMFLIAALIPFVEYLFTSNDESKE